MGLQEVDYAVEVASPFGDAGVSLRHFCDGPESQVTTATFADFAEGNKVLRTMKDSAKAGGARVTIRPLQGDPMFVSYFDASLGSGGGRAQQGEVHLMTTEDALRERCPRIYWNFTAIRSAEWFAAAWRLKEVQWLQQEIVSSTTVPCTIPFDMVLLFSTPLARSVLCCVRMLLSYIHRV